ncbi:E3 ubiquitin-protein ligase BRE1-like 2 [Diospyros lotus]|uniref:E3 ubiquitin-protein ligase BRE1-like 2 n=1 Tax=Diospyros lotus TaxID=55363 RepID=UPI00224E60E1|nr:E3 ubiquitin-protein ligase BRE1-like 2 [Diospyros lotus]
MKSRTARLFSALAHVLISSRRSRRKLVNLKMKKDSEFRVHTFFPGEGSKSLSELEESIKETKILEANRLCELQEAQEKNLILSRQLQNLQDNVKDEKNVFSSHLYTSLNDQFQYWNTKVEWYKGIVDSLQAGRSSVLRREKELSREAELLHAARNDIITSEFKVEELRTQLHNCIIQKNALEIKMQEALQDSGRKDLEAEFHVMASALSKELGMMEAQLKIWQEKALEAIFLREKVQSMKVLLHNMIAEEKSLTDTCAQQDAKIKSLKAHIEKLQKEKLESEFQIDMLGQQIYDNREIMDIKESEQRARSHARHLRSAQNEHPLELRLKFAKEAEAICQRRLSAAEAEIADLRAELTASDRDVLELKEAIKIKDEEREAYVSILETKGEAYEDMVAQTQRLRQLASEREAYNVKLIDEIVKLKKEHSHLLPEIQGSSLKLRTTAIEHQVGACINEELKSTKEGRLLGVNLETAVRELEDAKNETDWLKSAISSSEKEYEEIQRKIDEVKMELEKERSERKNLDEELKEVNNEVVEMSPQVREIQKLHNQIKDCKAMVMCGACLTRPKEVVIMKCHHLFCSPCIQGLLETWGCKCPNCGIVFEPNDVRLIKM